MAEVYCRRPSRGLASATLSLPALFQEEVCLLDYRTAAMFCWQYAVIILGALDAANERGLELFTDILERFVSIIVDLNAGELLPA